MNQQTHNKMSATAPTQIGQKTTPLRAPLGSSGDTQTDVQNLLDYLLARGKYASTDGQNSGGKEEKGVGMLSGLVDSDSKVDVDQFEVSMISFSVVYVMPIQHFSSPRNHSSDSRTQPTCLPSLHHPPKYGNSSFVGNHPVD